MFSQNVPISVPFHFTELDIKQYIIAISYKDSAEYPISYMMIELLYNSIGPIAT